MKFWHWFLQVIVKKLFKMLSGTVQLILSAPTIVFNNNKIIINQSLILQESRYSQFLFTPVAFYKCSQDDLWIKILPKILHYLALPSPRATRNTKGKSFFVLNRLWFLTTWEYNAILAWETPTICSVRRSYVSKQLKWDWLWNYFCDGERNTSNMVKPWYLQICLT